MPRNDYTPEQRKTWSWAQFNADVAAGRVKAHDQGIKSLPKAPNPFGKEGTLATQLAKETQRAVNRAVADKAPKHSTLHSNVPSTCLASLSWRDGVAYYSFFRGGQINYSTPMSKSDWLDWVASDSIGAYGNAEVFD